MRPNLLQVKTRRRINSRNVYLPLYCRRINLSTYHAINKHEHHVGSLDPAFSRQLDEADYPAGANRLVLLRRRQPAVARPRSRSATQVEGVDEHYASGRYLHHC